MNPYRAFLLIFVVITIAAAVLKLKDNVTIEECILELSEEAWTDKEVLLELIEKSTGREIDPNDLNRQLKNLMDDEFIEYRRNPGETLDSPDSDDFNLTATYSFRLTTKGFELKKAISRETEH